MWKFFDFVLREWERNWYFEECHARLCANGARFGRFHEFSWRCDKPGIQESLFYILITMITSCANDSQSHYKIYNAYYMYHKFVPHGLFTFCKITLDDRNA